MRFWGREIVGWLLVGIGLYIFWVCLTLTLQDRPKTLNAAGLTVIGVVVFRGGIHLLKVAVAARISLRAMEKPAVETKDRPPETSPWDWSRV